MLAHIQFQKRNRSWNLILRDRLPLLIEMIKKGKVIALRAATVTQGEAGLIEKEGFSFVISEHNNLGNILKIKILKTKKKGK